MKILFISAVLPYPLYSGGQVRIYNLLKQLSNKHKITLLSFIRTDAEREYAKDLPFLSSLHVVYRGQALTPRYLVKLFGKYPLLLETYNNDQMRQRIKSELDLGAYDLVHIEPFYVYPSLPHVSIPLVVSEHNIEYAVYEANAKRFPFSPLRPILAADAHKLRIWEERVWHRASSIVAVSNDDGRRISSVTNKEVTVVPNGVDISSFRYLPHEFNVHKPTFLFVGNFAWVPNREAVRRLLTSIWPAVVAKFPDARLTIVGRQFPSSLRRYVTERIIVKEDVADINKTFHDADVLLAPMGIGGGTKFKILEAMASGTAVITTKEGLMGLAARDKKHILLAQSQNEFASCVSWIYTNPKKTLEMTEAARELVEQAYDWRVIANILDLVWRRFQ